MFKPCFEHTEHFVSAGDPHRMHTFLIGTFEGSTIFSGPDGEGAPARDAGAAAPESRAVVFVDMTGEWIRGAPRARRVSRAQVWHLLMRSEPRRSDVTGKRTVVASER